MYVGAFHDENSAAYLENIADAKRVESTLLTFGAEAEPGSVSRAHVIEVEASALLVRPRCTLRLLVADPGVVVAHLRIFLNAEGVLLITPDCEP